MNRRAFLMAAAGGVISAAATVRTGDRVAGKSAGRSKTGTTKIALVRTADREVKQYAKRLRSILDQG